MVEKLNKEDLLAGIFGEKIINEKIGDEGQPGYVEILIEELYPSERNVYGVVKDEAMDELIASIKEKGILFPLLVRKKENSTGYEILSGHRRHFAASCACLEKVPCIIMDVSDEDRDIIIADSNLHRPYITVSEKARSIRMKYDAIKRKTNGELLGEPSSPNPERMLNNLEEPSSPNPDGRLSELGAPGAPKGKSASIIAEQMGLTDRTIKNYIRLTYLIEPLLEMVDEEQLPMKAGVHLSYLSAKLQDDVLAVVTSEKIKIHEDQAIKLKENLSDDSTINDVLFILRPELAEPKISKPKLSIKISKEIKKTYFPKTMTDSQINEILTELTKGWAEKNNPEYEGYTGNANDE